MLELLALVGALSAPLPPAVEIPQWPPVKLVDLTTFDPARWQQCVDTMNADPERGTDSDMAECDRLYDPEGVMAEEEANDGR